jgi:hypothetical protein
LKNRFFFVFLHGNLFLEKKMWVVMAFVGSELQYVLDYLEVKTQETHPIPSHFLSTCRAFGSGFGFNHISESGPESRRSKITQKNRNKFWSAGCSLLRAEGFSCSLDVLYGGLGISKLKFVSKNKIKILAANVFSIFVHQTGSRLVFSLKFWIRNTAPVKIIKTLRVHRLFNSIFEEPKDRSII